MSLVLSSTGKAPQPNPSKTGRHFLGGRGLRDRKAFVSLARVVGSEARRGVIGDIAKVLRPAVVGASILAVLACSTVDPGQDFNIAEVVYDENYYYCQVEPMLVAKRCGAGDSSQGDSNGSCHFNVTSYRLRDYSPLVADSCNGNSPQGPILGAARENYQSSQSRMQIDPEVAPLLTRPSGTQAHPRVIFDKTSPEADLIRQWATRFSTQ